MSQITPEPVEERTPNPTTPNAAVLRCCEAHDRSLLESKAKKADNYDTRRAATDAYRAAIPYLSGYENIRDFIACVSNGMVTGCIDAIEGPKFLYAAQVAIGALRHEPREQKRPAA